MPYTGNLARPEKLSGFVKLYLDRKFLAIDRQHADADDLREVAQACDLPDLVRLVDQIAPRTAGRLVPPENRSRLEELETTARERMLPPLNFLAQCWRLDLRGRGDVAAAAERLRAVAAVEEAYPEAAVHGPSEPACGPDAPAAGSGYLLPGPVGIGAAGAAPLEPSDGRVRVVDLESGWLLDHQYLAGVPIPLLAGDREADEIAVSHGTSVLGILLAAHGLLGELGSAPRTQFAVASHHRDSFGRERGGSGHVAATIVQLLIQGDVGAGDVLLVEAQRSWLPVELDRADRDAIRLASAHGVCVVEPAGNYGADLDALADLGVDHRLRRDEHTDSGAVLVGAARSQPQGRTRYKTNYGSRVDCFAWGENITAPGVHVPPLDPVSYTETFGKTSGAAAVIAAAAIIVQHVALRTRGAPLSPVTLRAVLSDPRTGTPLPGQGVGVMPDLGTIGGMLGAS